MLPIDNTLLPWSLDSALFALSFYASGNFLFPYIKQCINAVKLHEKKTWICINWIIVCIAVWLPLTLINGKVSLGSKVLHHGVLFYLTGMLGTMGVLSVSILLEKFRFLGYLGRNTFCIMSVHYMIRKFMLPKYYGIFGIPKYSSKVLKETIVPFILVFLLSLLVTAGYDRIKKSLESLLKRA